MFLQRHKAVDAKTKQETNYRDRISKGETDLGSNGQSLFSYFSISLISIC